MAQPFEQYNVKQDQLRGFAGQIYDIGAPKQLPYIAPDGAVKKVYTLVIDTASNSEAYSLDILGSTISYTSDGSATVAEIADGLAAAWQDDGIARGQFVASSDGVDTVTFTAVAPRVDVDIEENDNAAKMTLTETTAAAEEAGIGFGLFVYRDGTSTGVLGHRKCTLTNPGTAKQFTITVDSVDNTTEYRIDLEVHGIVYEVAYTSDGSATEAEITAGLDAALDSALSGVEGLTITSDADEVFITASVAGFNDFAVIGWTSNLAVDQNEEGDRPEDLIAGITSAGSYQQAPATIGGDAEWGPKTTIPVVYGNRIYVDGGASATRGGQVFVGQTGAEKGKAYTANDGSGGRLPVPKALAQWDGPNVIQLRLNA